MPTVQVNARINVAIKKALDDYCRRNGVVRNHFIQEALIRHEPTRPLRDALADLDLDEDG